MRVPGVLWMADVSCVASLVACLLPASAAAGLIYRPPQGTAKDNCVVWHEGRYHLFTMYRQEQALADGDPRQWRHMWAAVSTDGVHWQDVGPVIQDAPFTIYAMRIWRVGERFILNHGSFTGNRQDVLRFWESTDLLHWRYLGPEYDVRRPDGQRLDHMDVVTTTVDGKTAWYGYAAGGLLRSDDGVRWHWESDFAFSDNVPARIVQEPGGCERIGDLYYLLVGGFYHGSFNYSVGTFVSESPTGPFRPDYPAFRLTGNGGRRMVSLWAGYCRTPQELLISNYIVDPGGQVFWHAPLKRAVVDGGRHLRLGYWQGNEALKGDSLPVDLSRCAAVAPTAAGVQATASRVELGAAPRQAVWWQTPTTPETVVALLDRSPFDLARGVVIEGKLRVVPAPGGDLIFSAVGLVLEGPAGEGTGILFGTCGQTDLGPLTWTVAARLESADRIGFGCATVAGIPSGKVCTFRLLWRRDLFEIYLDDLLVQTYYTTHASGRIGFVVQDGQAVFEDVRAWAMTLAP